jgi:hypothetical protein
VDIELIPNETKKKAIKEANNHKKFKGYTSFDELLKIGNIYLIKPSEQNLNHYTAEKHPANSVTSTGICLFAHAGRYVGLKRFFTLFHQNSGKSITFAPLFSMEYL